MNLEATKIEHFQKGVQRPSAPKFHEMLQKENTGGKHHSMKMERWAHLRFQQHKMLKSCVLTFFKLRTYFLQEPDKGGCFKSGLTQPRIKSIPSAWVDIKHFCCSRNTVFITLQCYYIQINQIPNKSGVNKNTINFSTEESYNGFISLIDKRLHLKGMIQVQMKYTRNATI